MNYFAMQLNNLTDDPVGALRAALPPTDARPRPDLRAWEQGDFDQSTEEKDRLEDN